MPGTTALPSQLGLDNIQMNVSKSVTSGSSALNPVAVLTNYPDVTGTPGSAVHNTGTVLTIYPDVTTNIVDIHVDHPISACSNSNLLDSDEQYSVIPDYPIDSLPRQHCLLTSLNGDGITNLLNSSDVGNTSQILYVNKNDADSRTIASKNIADTRNDTCRNIAVTRTNANRHNADSRTDASRNKNNADTGTNTSRNNADTRNKTNRNNADSSTNASRNNVRRNNVNTRTIARRNNADTGTNASRNNADPRTNASSNNEYTRTNDIDQPASPSLSSCVGNVTIPMSRTTAAPVRVPVNLPPQLYSLSHSCHATSSPVVSNIMSNINLNVSNSATPMVSAGASRHIQTHNLDAGIVSQLDHQQQCAHTLPDVIVHSQAIQGVTPRAPSTEAHPRTLPVQRLSDSHLYHVHPHHHDQLNVHLRDLHSSDMEESCKDCCLKCLAVGTSCRWILVVLSMLGVCCVVTGIVLAALHASGNLYLFLAIMFIGLGVLLVVVVGVGWKCTPRGREPFHALCHIGNFHHRGSRQHGHRNRRDRGWHGGPMYPEFQYRRPPPSYNASMQEYQQQLAVAQHNWPSDICELNHTPDDDYSLPSSPPPSYRSRASTARTGIQITFPPNQGGYYPESRPPTYRSYPAVHHLRPSLTRDNDYDDNPPPADVAFTGTSIIVDTNISQNSSSIQISPSLVSNQNVTVSVTTVSISAHQPVDSPFVTCLQAHAGLESSNNDSERDIDPVGDCGTDKVDTTL